LFGDTEMVKYGRPIIIVGYNIHFVRGYSLDIGLGVAEEVLIVDNDFIEILIEQVTKHTGGLGLLTQYFGRRYGATQIMLNQFPGGHEVCQVFLIRQCFSFSRCTYDYAVFWQMALQFSVAFFFHRKNESYGKTATISLKV
jgi:hypothetical protein